MTTYSASAVSDTVIAYKKAITLQLQRALRDNMLAMFEGASGAPRLQLAAMDTWYLDNGQAGTYAFARYTGGADVAFGSTVAGADLQPTSAAYSIVPTGSGAAFGLGTALSGTWRCMGRFEDTAGTSNEIDGATLWLRVA